MADSHQWAEERTNLLTQKKPDLLRAIRLTPMFWASICKHRVITIGEIGDIQRNGTASPQTQIDELLNHVMMAINMRYTGFLTALAEAGQGHVVTQVLKEEIPEPPSQAVPGEVHQAHPSAGPQALVGTTLDPWHKNNPEGVTLYNQSPYQDVLNTSRVELVQHLQDEAIWPHLKMMGVINSVEEEQIKYNKSRPERIEGLLNFIEKGPRWYLHSLFRAMALTDQTGLIQEGGVDKAVYTQGCQSDHQGGAPLKLLSKDVLRVIRDHCQSYETSLMRRHVFDFDGDAGDDVIDISSCIINVDPHMKAGTQIRSIPTSQILEQIDDKVPPRVIRLYGDPGDGKTSLMRHIAHHWSTMFPQLIENDQSITSEPLSWTTLVYLEARNIKTTVDDAIREALGCKVSDTEILMNHIRTGDRVGILMDALDELRNKAAVEEVKRYIHERKMKGGPTVLMSARTGICPIDAQDIDRFLTLQGFTEEEGVLYVKKYSKMHHLPNHAVNHYVVQHREELQPVLTNPLRLYIFSALALRGEINLEEDGQFNIPKLFHPLERHLLRRSGTQVTEQQSRDWYRMCIWGLLKGLREFPGTLLEHFNIAPAYHMFLKRSDRRKSDDGKLVPYYSFSHEMVWEYFSACYIQTLSTTQKEAFLISICQDKHLRNVQKIVFQLLQQDWSDNQKLIQMMLRCILAMQDGSPVDAHLCDLVRLNVQSDSSIVDTLYSNRQAFPTTEAAAVCQQINDAFSTQVKLLREKAVFRDIQPNDTLRHVVDCLQICSGEQRKALLNKTIFCLLPCSQYDSWYYLQTGATQWGEVHDEGDRLTVFTCTPGDAADLVTQYVRTYHSRVSHPTWRHANIYLRDEDYTLWGVPPDCSWCKEEWHTLFNTLIELQVKELYLQVGTRTPLSGVLMYLLDHAAALHRMTCEVYRGRIQLSDLATLLPAGVQAGLDLVLPGTQVVVPGDVEESTLREDRDLLYDLPHSAQGYRRLNYPAWLTEDGHEFVWSDC